ncbi:MAG: dephospho-CoA kinase [Clostridia bacterium]|nr:dephospho-CoA kinase [Clostridia bacterium]
MRRLVIAITGGIGSGKSTLCALIKKRGYQVVSADETYGELLKDENFVRGVHLSVGIESDSKTLLRQEISNTVFSNAEKLKLLNDYTHGKIVAKMFENTAESGVVFHEVPLLFEGGFEKLYDKIIIVTRPLEDRIKAVMERSNLSKEEVKNRIKNQVLYENLKDIKHTVINNDCSESELDKKLGAVLDKIIY